MDHDASVLHEAALLHDFAELLIWLHAPALALQVAQRLRTSPGLRTAQAQREILNVELPELQQALMQAWRLPSLLVRITDDRQGESPQARNVQLAIRLARHSAAGWDDAALPDDVPESRSCCSLARCRRCVGCWHRRSTRKPDPSGELQQAEHAEHHQQITRALADGDPEQALP